MFDYQKVLVVEVQTMIRMDGMDADELGMVYDVGFTTCGCSEVHGFQNSKSRSFMTWIIWKVAT